MDDGDLTVTKTSTPAIDWIRELATLTFLPGPGGTYDYIVNPEMVPSMVALLDEIRADSTSNSNSKYCLGYDDDEEQNTRDLPINYLFDWLLRNHQEHLKTLTDRCCDFVLDSMPDVSADNPFHQILPYGCVDCFIDEVIAWREKSTVKSCARSWASGHFFDLLDQYLECADEHVQFCLGYVMKAVAQESFSLEEFLVDVWKLCRNELKDQTIIERAQSLIRQIPWWKYRLRPIECSGLFNFSYYDLFYPSPKLEGKLRLGPAVMLIFGLSNREQDNETVESCRQLFPVPSTPRFNLADLRYYPPNFKPTMKALFLAWKRLGLPKDIVRNIMPDYVLHNCYFQRSQTVINVEQKLMRVHKADLQKMHRVFVLKGVPPTYNHRSKDRRLLSWCFGAAGLHLEPNHEELLKQLHKAYFVFDFKTKKYPPAIEISKLTPEEIKKEFDSGNWVLHWIAYATHDRERTAQEITKYLNVHWTLTDIANWLCLT